MTSFKFQNGPREGKLIRGFLVTFMTISVVVASTTHAAKLTMNHKNHRMGELNPAKAQHEQLEPLDQATKSQTTTTSTSTTTTTASPASDIVINSIEDEFAGSSKLIEAAGNRHRYEQSQQQPTSGQLYGAIGSQEQTVPKIEARNQLDSPMDQQQQQHLEQVVVDHRPSQAFEEQQWVSNEFHAQTTPTQQPQASPSSTPSSAPTTTSATGTTSSTPNTNLHNQNVAATQMVPQWLASGGVASIGGQQQFYIASQPQQKQQQGSQQFGSLMPASSNQMVSVQHPTSINSIISEQQQQGTVSGPTSGQMVATINGQPTSLILLGQSPQGAGSSASTSTSGNLMPQQQPQFISLGQNGRRVSISNWLRGIGSMLANIFNRRDHNLMQTAMLASGSNGVAMLAPLSPNVAPQTVGSSSGSGGNWIQLGPNAPHWLTQAQSAVQQLGASSSRFATFIQAGPGQQVQPQTSAGNNHQQLAGDLQTSGSSNSLVSVQAPTSVSGASSNSQPYQSGTIVLIPSPAQQPQQQQATKQQTTSQTQAAPTARPHSDGAITLTGGGVGFRNQIASGGSGASQPTRFGRASASASARPQSSGNLPLSHYSQYSDLLAPNLNLDGGQQ